MSKKLPPMSKSASVKNKIQEVQTEWTAQKFVNSSVSIEEVRQIKTAFDIFDSQHSGYVDPIQVKNAFYSLGFASANKLVAQILQNINAKNQKGLTFAQFLNLATCKLSQNKTKAQINKVFFSFDTEKKGKVTSKQFKAVAIQLGQNMTDQQVQQIFAKADLDADGYLTAQDFYTVIAAEIQN